MDMGWAEYMAREEKANIAKYGDPDADKDAEGRCLVCLRNSEKQALIRRAQETNDDTEREVLLERVRNL